jgi:hypothetical protein
LVLQGLAGRCQALSAVAGFDDQPRTSGNAVNRPLASIAARD